jgi:DNA-binding LytR/AlgR family response regulator
MDKYLMIKTRDEMLRINIEHILYFEADRNYTKLLLAEGIQFTFAVNIGKIEEMLAAQISNPDTILIRVGKSHIVNKKHILQINLPKQKLLLLANEGKPRELIVPKDPLRALKDSLEAEVLGITKETSAKKSENNEN